MKKQNIYIILIAIITLLNTALFSCQAPPSLEYGEVGITMATDLSLDNVEVSQQTTKQNAYTQQERIYQVEIRKLGGATISSYDDHREIPASFKLRGGTYVFIAQSGDPSQTGFDTESYVANDTVVVVNGITQTVNIVAKLASIKMEMYLNENIRTNFKTTILTITPASSEPEQETQDLTQEPLFIFNKEDEGKSAYIPATQDAENVDWELTLVNNQNVSYTIIGTLMGLKSRDYLKFNFKIENQPDGAGVVMLEIRIDKNLDIVEHTINILQDITGEAPSFVANGFAEGQVVVVNVEDRGVTPSYIITAPLLIEQLWLYHNNKRFVEVGIPKSLDLADNSVMTADMVAILNRVGVVITATNPDTGIPNAVNGASSVTVDFTKLANESPIADYEILITAIDKATQYDRRIINISIVPDQEHELIPIEPIDIWTGFINVKGRYLTTQKPEGLTFQYKKATDGADEWLTIPLEQVTHNEDKEFSTTIKGLTPQTLYNIRTSSNVSQGISNPISTDKTHVIPNMSLDGGHWSGKTFYPNASGGNSFWGTGNEGLTAAIAGGNPSNTIDTDDAVKGRAIVMTSIGGITLVGHAAGNLYTGDFELNFGDPSASVKFGRKYTGRPTSINVSYKYKSTPITVIRYDEQEYLRDKSDLCHIYIKLENRNGNATEVAYGEFISDIDIDIYTQINIPIVYKRTDIKPTHITLVATSSRWGDKFCGGWGSKLWVDEFVFGWE